MRFDYMIKLENDTEFLWHMAIALAQDSWLIPKVPKNSITITISKILKWENKWLFVNPWGIYANCVSTLGSCVRGQNEN